MRAVNIINPSLPNQVETGEWIHKGLEKRGIKVRTSSDPTDTEDLIFIHGPNYALRQHFNAPNLIRICRCFYGETDDWISISLNDRGRRYWPDITRSDNRFRAHIAAGALPWRFKMREEGDVIYLDDYAEQLIKGKGSDKWAPIRRHYRAHPGKRPSGSRVLESGAGFTSIRNNGDLEKALEGCGRAVGAGGTSLAYAAIRGLMVFCFDVNNVAYPISNVRCEQARQRWGIDLAWKQWHKEEVREGDYLRSLALI
jgi:hypothetical protein